MSNIIALVWDFDKTLVDGYMQDPIFEYYDVDPSSFWDECNSLPDICRREQSVRVNPETAYLNVFIRKVKSGIFPGLNNEKLREFGSKVKFYDGVPEIFESTKKIVEDNPAYSEYDIKVEHYIVSTGLLKVIEGSAVSSHVLHIWGCDFIEDEIDRVKVISEVGYTIDNTTKTRALFEINKGVHTAERSNIDVNSSIPEEYRRVKFCNMIYIADGPSDIPSFSLMKKNGGEAFAVYPKGDADALKQVELMRMNDRISMYAEADYSEGTTAYMWLCEKIKQYADRIVKNEREKLKASFSPSPSHII